MEKEKEISCWVCKGTMRYIKTEFNKDIKKTVRKYKCDKCGEIVYAIIT